MFAAVPAVVNGGESPVADFGSPGRAVLVSLDTPASAGAASAPTAGSSWAAVTVPASEQRPDGSLPDRLTRAIFDFVRDLATGRATGPDPTVVEVPVQGVAGSSAGSGTAGAVRFTGTSSPPETIAIGTPDEPAVVILCIIKVVTAVPAPATDPTTTTTTEPAPTTSTPSTTSTTTEPKSEPATTTTEPSKDSPTTSTTEPGSNDSPTTTTTDPEPTTTTTDPEPTTTTTSPDPSVDPPTDPVTLPGIIDVSPQPVTGARDLRVWPFASDSVWNTPRGAGATFDARQVVAGGEINANNGFGVSVGNAGYALVDQINTNPYAESHYSIVNPDGVSATEWYQYQNVGNVNRNSSVTDLRGSGLNTRDNSLGGSSFRQQRASLVSQLGGLVRAYDLSQGVIRHALSIALPNRALKAGWVWPAFGQDGDARTAYDGFVPMGSYLAIPSNAPMPAGLSPVGEMVWTALRDYGAYVVDRGATAPMVAEASAAAAVNPARADLSRIWSQLRVVTNADQNDVGGPGPRLAPAAPAISGG